MKRARLIVNPAAGADRAGALLPLMNERLRSIVTELDVTITTGEADVVHAASRAAAEGCDALFVAGGDGTLNRALRGLVTPAGQMPQMVIGLIPTGTGNDFAKALGLGEDAEAALDAFGARRAIAVDIGTVNGVPFINASAGGFVADVSQSVTEGLKDVAGKLAYLIGGARALLGSEPFAARLNGLPAGVRLPQPTADWMDLRMFAVCNARFIGGGYPIAPGAVIDDGLVDVALVPHLPTLEFLAVLQRIAAGDDGDRSDLVHFRTASLDFEFSRTVRVNTDGEVLETRSARYRVHRRAATFLCGAEPKSAATPSQLA